MDEALASRPNGRRDREAAARVLIIAHPDAARELESALPPAIAGRSVRTASDTEGLGAEIVVIGGPSLLTELAEVRVHPQLSDKPVVLFAPSRDLPAMDWSSMSVWQVTSEHNAVGQLVAHVRHLLAPRSASTLDLEPA